MTGRPVLSRRRRDELEAEVERLRRVVGEGSRREARADAAYREELAAQEVRSVTARQVLEESRDRLENLFDFAPVGYLALDGDGVVREMNLTGAVLLGRARGQVEGLPLSTFAADQHLLLDHLWRCRRAAGETVVSELDLRRPGGERLPAELESRAHQDRDRLVIYTAVRDIRERRRLEQALAQAVWNEQRRIAEMLHDDLGQVLTGAALVARGLAGRLTAAGDAGGAAAVRELLDALREAQQRMRDFSRNLHPSLEEVPADRLPEVLDELAGEAERQFGIACRSGVAPDAAIDDPEVATQLFHIAREAVTNAARHGAPSAVTVTLARDGFSWLLRIADDGSGFDERRSPSGIGTRLMRYRARLLGGELTVRSEAGAGTTVSCRVPRRSPARAAEAR